MGDDRQLQDEVIALLREEGPRQLESLRSALAADDATAVHLAAHALRGSAANFGAGALIETLAEVETAARRGDLSAGRTAFPRVDAEAGVLMTQLGDKQALACAS